MDLERFMFDLMTQLTDMGVPIVFKGAMVLKAIQMKYGNPTDLWRETHDIDGKLNSYNKFGKIYTKIEKFMETNPFCIVDYPIEME